MIRVAVAFAALAALSLPASAQELTAGMKKGEADLKSAGALAFGPEGVLFVADPQGGAIVAIATGDATGDPEGVKLDVQGLDGKIASALGTAPGDMSINDLAINPASGRAYLSISRGKGPAAVPVIVTVDAAGKIAELAVKELPSSRAALPNAPAGGNQRAEAITDIAYSEGRVIVAGLSNEEFASNLRQIPFPFKATNGGSGVEIFHGAHGKFETKSPVRTFAMYSIAKQPHVLAAYTCTPLVKFPLKDLAPGAKVRGTTIAELGNRNKPLDMIVYQQGGKDFALLANSSRGVMKIALDGVDRATGITEKINDKAGTPYETIGSLKGVTELDRLNKGHAAILVKSEAGAVNLQTIPLP